VTGAQTASLYMQEKGQWSCVGRQHEGVFTPNPPENLLPESVLNYCGNSKKKLLLKNACQEGDFLLDSYIKAHHCLSLLSIPLLFDNKVSGVLLLEHGRTSGLFTPYQLNLVEVLLSQYLISYNNSVLFRSLQASNFELEDKVSNRTQELQRKTHHLEAILAALPLPYVLTRMDGSVIAANARFCEQFSLEPQKLEGVNIFDLYVSPIDRQRMIEGLRTYGNLNNIECELKAYRGQPFWAQFSSTLIQLESEKAIFSAISDISERKLKEHMLKEQASTDPLTGVLNRRAYLELSAALHREGGPTTVLAMLDLDHFKKLNDSYGHAAGDEVLKGFARLVSGVLREKDLFGRIGGEEFSIALVDVSLEQAQVILDRIRHELDNTRFPNKDEQISVTTSIGATAWIQNEPILEALERADQALYKAKHKGRNRIVMDSSKA
jgi:diguanylate cyclase (GGDEF)-like protein/PAS domain S-box-containing protein